MKLRHWFMGVVAVIAIIGTWGLAIIPAAIYFFYVWRDEQRERLVRQGTPDDMDDPLNQAIMGDMTYKEQIQNEQFRENMEDWK
ncbi:MAG: hypothetical protein MPJ08_08595 [Nitrosopumilus sp.]|nr:hypothetical protein [Nitrosopumilus sp.]